MVWIYGNSEIEPALVTYRYWLGSKQRTVKYRAEDCTEGEYTRRWQAVQLETGVWGYDAIVAAIVTAEYPSDRMQAVVNNYLAQPEDAAIKAEFDEMQDWRAYAKSVARKCLETDSE